MKGSEMTVIEAMQERQALQNLVEREMKRFVDDTGLGIELTAEFSPDKDTLIAVGSAQVSVYLPD